LSGLLKWDGNVLRLGKTQMAEVRAHAHGDHSVYVIGPDDFTSKPYEEPDDARQDCERHVRQMLKKAGVENA
jgi:hypothetical protein